jgi:hypothetical protein
MVSYFSFCLYSFFIGIFEIKTRKGLALVDIVREVTTCYSNRFVFQIKMKSDVRVPLINDLADIEYVHKSFSYLIFICILSLIMTVWIDAWLDILIL